MFFKILISNRLLYHNKYQVSLCIKLKLNQLILFSPIPFKFNKRNNSQYKIKKSSHKKQHNSK